MATRLRRDNKDLPPDLSDLMDKLIKHAASFIKGFDNNRGRMRQIVGELQKIAGDVRRVQKETDTGRTAGGIVLGLGILAVPFTGGVSLLGVAVGAAVVAGSNVAKLKIEKGNTDKVEELGKEFMKLVEPLKIHLEKIKKKCEKLEQRSAEGQAERSLSDMEELQKILRRVSELRRRSGEVLDGVVTVLGVLRGMLLLIVSVIRVTATPEQDQELIKSIIQSADQCQKVTDAFDEMKEGLRAFI